MNVDDFLSEVEFIMTTPKKKKKKEKKSFSNHIDVIAIPPLESLDPLTRRLVRLGLLDLKDVERVLEVDREAKTSRKTIDFSDHFSALDRAEELEQVKEVIQKSIEEAKNRKARMIRVPFFAFRDVIPDVSWRDLERLAREMTEDSSVTRAVFEDAVLTIVLQT